MTDQNPTGRPESATAYLARLHGTSGPQTRRKATCGTCGRDIRVKLDGKLYDHKTEPGGDWCDGVLPTSGNYTQRYNLGQASRPLSPNRNQR